MSSVTGVPANWPAYRTPNRTCRRSRTSGLVTRVLPDKEILLSAASELAGMLAGKSPLALRGTKQVLNYSRDHSVAGAGTSRPLERITMLISSDIQAAVMAQMQGQTPVFAD